MRGTVKGLAHAGQASAGETFRYYSTSGKDERRIVHASFFMGILGGVMWYVIALYWDALGFSSHEIGLIGGIGSAVGVVSLLVSGFLADLFGRKKLLLMGLGCNIVGAAMFLSPPVLVVFITAEGLISLGYSLTGPSIVALMAGKALPVKLKFFFGVQNFSNQIGITVASATGIFFPGFLFTRYGLETASGYWYVVLAAVLCSAVPVLYILRVSETKRRSERFILNFDRLVRRTLLVYSAQNALIGVGAGLVIPWLPLVFQNGMGATSTQLAAMVTASNIALAIAWFIVPKFAEARGSVLLIAACQIASVAFLLAIPYSAFSLLLVAFLFAARSVLMLVPTPVLNAYIMNIVKEDIRASFYGVSQLAWTVAFSAAYAVSGYIWADDYSKVEPFIYCSVLYVVATLIFYLYFRNIAEPKPEPEQTR